MRIGEYRIIIQSTSGEVLAELDRTTATGHPAVGEEIAVDGMVYIVERVRHEDDPCARATRRYTAPRLFVRRRDGLVRGRRKDAQRSPRVLPFSGPRQRRLDKLTSVLLPPSLVAVIVAAGYDAQVRHFQRRGRGGVRLSRVGQGWFLEAGESPAEALSLAREARRQRRRAEQLLCRLAAVMPFQAAASPSLTMPSATSSSSLPSPLAPSQPLPSQDLSTQARPCPGDTTAIGESTSGAVHGSMTDSTWCREPFDAADTTLDGDAATVDDEATCAASCGTVRARAAARSPPAAP